METLIYSCLVKALHARFGRQVLELDCKILNENHGFLLVLHVADLLSISMQ